MLSILLIFLLGGDPVPLDEIYVSKLGRSAQSGSRVVFSVMNRVKPELYFFDFETGTARLIEDGRIRVFIPHITADDQGFTLIAAVGQPVAYRHDLDGQFQEKIDLAPCLPLEPGQKIYAITEDTSGLLVTVNDEETSRLIHLDLEACRSEHRYTHRTHGHRGAWFTLDGKYFFVATDTGEIRRLDKDFSKTEVVRPGIDPVKRPEGTAGRSTYLSSLTEPNHVGDRVAFRFLKTRDAYGALLEEPLERTLTMTADGFEESTDYLLGHHEGVWLAFSQEDKELTSRSSKD